MLFIYFNYLIISLNTYYSVDVVYLDFQKAFDTVSHQHLIQKLSSFGIHGKMLQWMEDFLKDRTLEVVLNGFHSRYKWSPTGISVGSHLIYNVYHNDLPSAVLSPLHMFADNTKIFHVTRNYSALQHDSDLFYDNSCHFVVSQFIGT